MMLRFLVRSQTRKQQQQLLHTHQDLNESSMKQRGKEMFGQDLSMPLVSYVDLSDNVVIGEVHLSMDHLSGPVLGYDKRGAPVYTDGGIKKVEIPIFSFFSEELGSRLENYFAEDLDDDLDRRLAPRKPWTAPPGAIPGMKKDGDVVAAAASGIGAHFSSVRKTSS